MYIPPFWLGFAAGLFLGAFLVIAMALYVNRKGGGEK